MPPLDTSATEVARLASHPGEVRRFPRSLGPLLLGAFLLLLNHSGTLAGLISPPPGYVSNLVARSTDLCQYVTWMHAFQKETIIPDYHAPWLTGPALFNPALWFVARGALLLHLDVRTAYILFQYALYVVAAYGLLFAIRAFTETRAQARAALIAAVLAVPIASLLALPWLLLPAGLKSSHPTLPGIGDFVWMSSDGFFHGICGSALVTLGTASMLLAFGLLARYFRTNRRRFFIAAAALTGFSAFLHPFEVCVIAGAGGLALILRDPRNRRQGFADAILLGTVGAIGILPYVVMTLRHPWLHAAGKIPSWVAYSPPRLVVMLGLPMMVALALSLYKPRLPSGTDLLLLAWVLCTLVGLYVPGLPDVQHFLDGIHYAGALLLIRQAVRLDLYRRIRASWPRAAAAALGVLGVLSVAPYFIYSYQGFIDGRSIEPARLPSEVIAEDEAATVAWLQMHAHPDELVLGPARTAPLLATPPMHSFASHQIFSLTYDEQVRLRDAFFAGRLSRDAALAALAEFGVRYVVVPISSPAVSYMQAADLRARIGSFQLFEFPDHRMKAYAPRTARVFR